MTDILDETLQDLQGERTAKLLHKYGKPLLAITAAVLIGALAKVWWDGRITDKAHEEGAQFMETIKSLKDSGGNSADFSKIMEGKSVYSTLAGLNMALIESYGTNFEKAAKTYSTIAENNGADRSFREYANLMSITMGLAAQNLSEDDALAQLDKYINSGAIFKFSAMEIKAALLLESGKFDDAKIILQNILNDKSAPDALKGRIYEELLIATPAKR